MYDDLARAGLRWVHLSCDGCALRRVAGTTPRKDAQLIWSRVQQTLVAALAAGLVIGTATANAQVDAYKPTGPIVVDSGFRPDVNGFGFPNYGHESYVKEMTEASLIEMFGGGVCVADRTSPCVLTPNAAQWMAATNDVTSGGHSYGFSVSALRFFTGGLSPKSYGAPTVPALKLRDSRVQELLARTSAHQTLPLVESGAFQGSPNKVLAEIERVLADPAKETWTIGVVNEFGGHAVTPYAVEDRGNGRRTVLVYDNNWPGITRAFEFDTLANSYTFIGGGELPTFKGDARTYAAATAYVSLYPTSPVFRTQRCWFCGRRSGARTGNAAGASQDFVEIHLTGNSARHGHLLIEDAKGRKLGYRRGKLISQIPQAEIVRPLTTQATPDPIYRLPSGKELTVTIDGSPLKRPDTAELSVIGSRELFYVTPITLRPGQKDRLFLRTGDGIVTYASDRRFGRNAPAIAAGVTRGSGRKQRHYVFAAVSLRSNAKSIQLQGDFDLGSFGVAGIDGLRGPAHYYTLLSRFTRRQTDNWVAPRLRVDDSEVSVSLFDQIGGRNSRVPISIFRTRDLKQVRTEYMKPDRKENRASDRAQGQRSAVARLAHRLQR